MQSAISEDLLSEIKDLKTQLSEAQEAIDAIKSGSVDAFAMKRDGKPEVFTLQSLDYAYRVLIEKFSEGALNVTREGLIVYSNSYFSELLNLPNEKVTGSSIFDLISPESLEKFREHFSLSILGCSKTEIVISAAGKNIPVYVSLSSLHPRFNTVGIIVTDLSEKKRSDQQITNYTATLREKNLELGHLNKSLEQFASIASHDLQEPLRKIQTFTSLIKLRFSNDLSEGARELLEKIKGSSERMSLLIKDVLNFSRTVHSEKMFVTTDLNGILNNVLKDFDLLILEKNASIRQDTLPFIEAIPLQINQLFYNLVGNALKFSVNGTSPVITISSRMLSPDEIENNEGMNGNHNHNQQKFNVNKRLSYVEISFNDNGIGFEQQFAEQIFSVFERLHTRQQYSGTGIGLALCQKIAENHRGRIHAEAKENEGATFYVLLPLTQSALN
jgi:PAS domain S-box-containing protein